MEVPVADVARDGVDEMRLVLVNERGQLRQEFGVAGGRDDEVVNERRGDEAVEILAEQIEALAPDNPILLRFFFVFLNLGLHV
ncbi:MAG: hypothetical protein B7W98_02865 [Parcubacteria group bacterium 20-58-5]|nr:MAG: hypothetical protein B7W98_02865 [Parcubacteria group bacterium 20-58-5]